MWNEYRAQPNLTTFRFHGGEQSSVENLHASDLPEELNIRYHQNLQLHNRQSEGTKNNNDHQDKSQKVYQVRGIDRNGFLGALSKRRSISPLKSNQNKALFAKKGNINVQDMGGHEDGQCDSIRALALQSSPQGVSAHPLAINSCCKNTKLHPTSNGICHDARQKMMVVKDSRIQNFPPTYRLNEEDI